MRVILVATDASPPAPARKDPGAVVVNVKRREIWRLGRVAEFPSDMQFRFASSLIVRRGALLTYREFIDALYGDDPDGGPLWASYAASKWGGHVKPRLATIGLRRYTVYGHGVRLEGGAQ